jgi:hypothetical protein
MIDKLELSDCPRGIGVVSCVSLNSYEKDRRLGDQPRSGRLHD